MKNIIRKGSRRKDIIADMADTLKTYSEINQINNKQKPTLKSRAKIIPNDVATPFPPLNLRKTENI